MLIFIYISNLRVFLEIYILMFLRLFINNRYFIVKNLGLMVDNDYSSCILVIISISFM